MAHNISEAEVSRAVQALRAQGIPDKQIAEVIDAMHFGSQPMSQTDGVTMQQFDPNVSGAYVSSEQKLQDAYSQNIAAQQVQETSGMQGDPLYFLKTPDFNAAAQVASTNPNYSVVTEGQRQTVDSNGNVVIY